MKINSTKIWIIIIPLIILGGAFLFVFNLHINSPPDYSCSEKASGETIISGKVFDHSSKKLLDSIDLEIRFGMSGDLLLDTTLVQKDSFYFVFNIDKAYECENFWYFLSDKKYYSKHRSYWDYDSTNYILKGKTVRANHYLKPASRVKVFTGKNNSESDSLFILLVHGKDSLQYKWEEKTTPLDKIHTEDIWEYDNDTILKASWTVHKKGRIKTFHKELKLIPFDTVDLKILY